MPDNTPITKSDLQEMFAASKQDTQQMIASSKQEMKEAIVSAFSEYDKVISARFAESEKRADARFTEFTQSLMVALDERFDGVEKEFALVRGEIAEVRKDMESGFAVLKTEIEKVNEKTDQNQKDILDMGKTILEALGTRADKSDAQSQNNTEQLFDHERRIQQLEKFPRMAAA